MILTKEDCLPIEKWKTNLEVGYCILSPDAMKEEYKNEKYQLVSCGGFACNPRSIAAQTGSGVFVTWCIDDDHSRYEREYILGIAKPETVKGWLERNKDAINCSYWPEHHDNMVKALEKYIKKTDQELIEAATIKEEETA